MLRLLRRSGVQIVLAWILGAYLHLALRTTRWTLVGGEHLDGHLTGSPVIAGFWHECLPLIPALWPILLRRGATGTPNVLISKHRDGKFISTVIRRFGVRIVHGSSSKTGSAQEVAEKSGVTSVRILLGVLKAGDHVLITPDGPRGPRRQAARGVAQIAALSGVPILPIGAQTTRRLRLSTWDRTIVPQPFGRGTLVCGPPIAVPREDWESALPRITAGLTAVMEEADRLTG